MVIREVSKKEGKKKHWGKGKFGAQNVIFIYPHLNVFINIWSKFLDFECCLLRRH